MKNFRPMHGALVYVYNDLDIKCKYLDCINTSSDSGFLVKLIYVWGVKHPYLLKPYNYGVNILHNS